MPPFLDRTAQTLLQEGRRQLYGWDWPTVAYSSRAIATTCCRGVGIRCINTLLVQLQAPGDCRYGKRDPV